ncbi:MAG: CoA transferase [Deltaproteobacteria bacterium]|nr:CoA transferase [Deltaproteobacteria bacterium]MDH3382841.1 CoA transferase [Deltaproteobacteria bacterium]
MRGFEDWAKEATDPKNAAGKPEALPGLRVLELSPGHFGGMVAASVLAEFGAEVIKVEAPGGDPARNYVPEGIVIAGTGLPFLSEARNRKFVTLSLEDEEGVRIFRRLAAVSDVVVETEGPARMDPLGLGYEFLARDHPAIIYLSLSTYGVFGPDASRRVKDSDILCQALSGVPYVTGDPEENGPGEEFQVPTRTGNWHGWFAQGLWGALGVLAALMHRDATGRGQMVDVAGAEAMMKFVDYNITWMHTAGRERRRTGKFDPAVFPYTYIRCRDGYTFIAAYNDEAFESLMHIIGRPELAADPRFRSGADRTRIENEKVLHAILEEWSGTRTADEILREIERYTSKKSGHGAAVVTGRVNRPLETLSESNWWERGCFSRVDDPVYGNLLLAAPPWKMSGTPPRIRSVCRPPGADNEEVYAKLLGMTGRDLSSLRARGIL